MKVRKERAGTSFLLRTNANGFACPHDFTSRKEPGRFRILLFGDSQTAGEGVSEGARFGDHLEKMIPGVEVYNFGMPTTGTDQQYLIFKEFEHEIEHDLLLVCPWVENIERVAASHSVLGRGSGRAAVYPRPHFVMGDDGELTLRNVPVPREPIPEDELPADARPYALVAFPDGYLTQPGGSRTALVGSPKLARTSTGQTARTRVTRGVPSSIRAVARRILTRLGPRALSLALRVYSEPVLPMYRSTDDPDWRLLRAILERWATEAPAPMLICPIPMREHIEGLASPRHYLARFREIEDRHDVVVHDVMRDLSRRDARSRRGLLLEGDPHLSPEGHLAVAMSLVPVIRLYVEGAAIPADLSGAGS